jgi:putative transposase of IS4/5 family DUF4096
VTEGTANFLVNRRMNKSQQMRWSRKGADLLLQVRCAVYNGALGSGFGHLFEPVSSPGTQLAKRAFEKFRIDDEVSSSEAPNETTADMASYSTDVSEAAWALIRPHLPSAKPGGRPRSTDLREVVNAIFYLLRTGCQWRLLPRCFPPWGTVYHFSASGSERACG